MPGTSDPDGCTGVYAQEHLPWFNIETDLGALAAKYAAGSKEYQPAVFEYWGEGDGVVSTRAANVRLRGNPGFSWIGPKMQFVVSFNEDDPEGRWRGLRKLSFDASWYHPSLLRDRLAYAYLRRHNVPAPCANNARVSVNGEYFGLYGNIEYMDHEWLERVYGKEAATGVLWKYGWDPKTNEETADSAAIAELWANPTVAWMEEHTDLAANLDAWAAEALLPQNDGYWCCSHNFYVYQHPEQGFQWVPWDMDYTLDITPYFADPGTWYRDNNSQPHLEAVMVDAEWGPRWIDALGAATESYDSAIMQEQVRTWGAQIDTAFAEDPHSTISLQQHRDSKARLEAYIPARQAFMRSWVDCAQGLNSDLDGDGVGTCGGDCDDGDAAIHAGAVEQCNGRDDDCNGWTDEGADCDPCEEVAWGDSRMLVCADQVGWSEAVDMCERNGATLGFPADSYDWYVLWIDNYWHEELWTGSPWWWGGITDAASEGTWVDLSGQVVAPSWLGGEGAGGNTQNCGALAMQSWAWGDLDCATELPVVCRIE